MSSEVRTPPGPRGVPLFGAFPELVKNPLAFYRRMALDYGDISYARLGPAGFYCVNESSLIEEFLVGQPKSCVKDATTRELYPLVGHGLLTSEGELWRRQRKLAAPPFQPKRISSYADTMVDAASRTYAGFLEGELRDFHTDIMALTLEIVGRTLLGVNTREESEEIARVIEAAFVYYEHRLYSWFRMLPPRVPTPSRVRFHLAKRRLDKIVYRIIDRCRTAGPEEDHLLARLMRARTEDGEAMSQRQLHDEALTMLLAGHETTALAMMYAVYLIARHPAQAARLRAEVDDVLEGRRVTSKDLERMPYLDAVLREALRLYPPAYAFGREVVTPFELGGYPIAKGSQVIVTPYGVHRRPEYFPDPERFDPERWLDARARALPRFAYLPFGGGPRVCIGSHFAMMEAGLLLATLVQQVELSVPADFTLTLSPVITLRSRIGLPVRVKRRPSAALGGEARRDAG